MIVWEPRAALALFPVTVIPHMLVGGLFLVVSDIPKYFYWLLYISPFFYAFVTLVRNEMEDVTFKCRSVRHSPSRTRHTRTHATHAHAPPHTHTLMSVVVW